SPRVPDALEMKTLSQEPAVGKIEDRGGKSGAPGDRNRTAIDDRVGLEPRRDLLERVGIARARPVSARTEDQPPFLARDLGDARDQRTGLVEGGEGVLARPLEAHERVEAREHPRHRIEPSDHCEWCPPKRADDP